MHIAMHRIINSVLMDNVAVEDGCNIQNSIVCSDACLQVHMPMCLVISVCVGCVCCTFFTLMCYCLMLLCFPEHVPLACASNTACGGLPRPSWCS